MIGQPFWCYKKIAESELSPDLLEESRRVLAFASGELSVNPVPSIVWVVLATRTECGPPRQQICELRDPRRSCIQSEHPFEDGLTPLHSGVNEIWLRVDARRERVGLPFVILHEWRHAWQKQNPPHVFRDKAQAEWDAYPYAYRALKEYLASVGELNQQTEDDIDAMSRRTDAWLQERFPKA